MTGYRGHKLPGAAAFNRWTNGDTVNRKQAANKQLSDFCCCTLLSSLHPPWVPYINPPTPLCQPTPLSPRAALEAIHIRGDQSVFLVHTLSRCQTEWQGEKKKQNRWKINGQHNRQWFRSHVTKFCRNLNSFFFVQSPFPHGCVWLSIHICSAYIYTVNS